ncbi:PKD domain-containing protein [Nubsella zeaxanthinifaciens]|uniref:PKD domain-containing protein n=1 Tax=Nubsella zeaxanthinifaciens TaxID=392412 RepID=UPI000DE47D7B|nr:PKD domain-containing protein [Nubsella zeaxanthinifaciens]
MKVYLSFALSLFCFLSNVSAQGTSNKGTDFWLMYGAHVSSYSGNSPQKMSIYVTSDVSTTGKLDIPGISYTTNFSVNANQVTVVDIPLAAYVGGTEGKFNKGMHLTSVKPIVAYAHIYDSSVSGATLVLPTNTLGKDYYSLNFTQKSNSLNAYSFCSIVAVEDNTQVNITPSVPTQGGWPAGVQQTINLNKGEVYQILGLENSRVDLNPNGAQRNWSTTGGDLTGTIIKSVAANGQSCKKIAVFSGSTKISISCVATSPGSADNLFQQVYPTATWGKSFITVPSKNRNYDIYRIFKSNPSAVVKLNGTVIPSANFVNNFYYEFASQNTNFIESDNSIQVAQYQVTQGRTINCTTFQTDVGDPEMIYLNPLEQTLDKITMYSSSFFAITAHYINVVIKTSDAPSFTLDGVAKGASFVPVPQKTGYSFAQLNVTSGTHTLQANGGFNAIAYGFGNAESYGYAAGASLISPGIEVFNGSLNAANKKNMGCVNATYDVYVSLPYQPLSIKIDIDNGQPAANVPLQLTDTYTNNDILYYRYKVYDQISFATAKKYVVKVTAEKPISDGCGAVDELELEYEILDNPSSQFDISAGATCEDKAVTFTDKSLANGNTIVKWYWDFGDGKNEVRTSATPFTHSYVPGNYSAKLLVENQSGCLSEAITKDIKVYNLPNPTFSTTMPLCESQRVRFIDQSTSVDGTITAWLWDFGDGQTSTEASPAHTFSGAGNYAIKLTVTTQNGCEKSIVKNLSISPSPILDFELPDLCLADAKATFINKTTISDNSVLSYVWDFGDYLASPAHPNVSSAVNGQHVYTAVGIYQVTLTVTTVNGCVSVIKKQFRVNGSIPKAGFEVVNQSNLCSNAPVSFLDKATVDFGEITRIEWYFDFANKTTPDIVDDNPQVRSANSQSYLFKYPTFSNSPSKTYLVKMVVYSGGSCVSEEVKSITIYPEAVVDFSLESSCLKNGTAVFNNTSSYINNNATLTYKWDFGDPDANAQNPNTSSAKVGEHNYIKAGRYTVSLTVTTPLGCDKTITKEIVVDGALPVADFTVLSPDVLCVQSPVRFEDNTSIIFGNITKIEWYYDFANNPSQVVVDNSPGTSTNPKIYSHQYPIFSTPLTKTYTVKMVAYSGNTCVSTVEKTITLNAMPEIDFTAIAEICLEAPEIQLTAQEKNGINGTGIFSGKGVSANGIFNPSLAGIGSHDITYTFSSEGGCSVQATQKITVNPTPIVDAGEDRMVLEGGQIRLNATATGAANLTYKWTPSLGLDRDDVLNPIVKPTDDMMYTLTVKSDKGCTQSDVVFVKLLRNLDIPSAITPNGDQVNDVWNIKYLDSYPSVKVDIYDRTGQKVFESKGYQTPFDGTYKGNQLPVGVYYYIINLVGYGKPITGTLTIIK